MSSDAISTLRLSRWVRRRASLAVVVVLPEPCRPTIMMATGGTALKSMVWPSEPSVAISSSWTILTTIWPGVTDFTTVAPTACSRTRSVKLLTTSSETSASSSARRTSRIAASTSASDSEPRPVRRSSMPPSFSDRLSNNAVLPVALTLRSRRSLRLEGWPRAVMPHPSRRRFAAPQDEGRPNTFAPEGASRCRALTSGLEGPGGGSKRTSFRELRRLNPCKRGKSRKVGAKWRFREPRGWATPLPMRAF